MSPESYLATRNQLRGIAECLIAGPQFRAAGTIRLAVRPAGFAGTVLPVEVQGGDLIWTDGRVALTGTLDAVAGSAGLQAGPPDGVYQLTEVLPGDTELDLDLAAADVVYRSLYAGGGALVAFAPDQHPVLWPEHFDVAVTENEVNYGVSPGDSYLAAPYAYVAAPRPQSPRTGTFWNAPFGAALPLDMTAAEADVIGVITEFFELGRAQL
jgi:hypothetical protein